MMEILFKDVYITISADSAKEAYAKLEEILAPVKYWDSGAYSVYRNDDDEPIETGDTFNLIPKGA